MFSEDIIRGCTEFAKDVAPIKKIKGLMDMLGVKSQDNFVEDNCSAWVYDLLNCRELGYWVA